MHKMFCDIYTKRSFDNQFGAVTKEACISLNFLLSLFLCGTQWKALLIRSICWIIYCKHDNVIIVHAGPQGPNRFCCACVERHADNAFSRITLIPANIKIRWTKKKKWIVSASWPFRLILLCLTAGRDTRTKWKYIAIRVRLINRQPNIKLCLTKLYIIHQPCYLSIGLKMAAGFM